MMKHWRCAIPFHGAGLGLGEIEVDYDMIARVSQSMRLTRAAQ